MVIGQVAVLVFLLFVIAVSAWIRAKVVLVVAKEYAGTGLQKVASIVVRLSKRSSRLSATVGLVGTWTGLGNRSSMGARSVGESMGTIEV